MPQAETTTERNTTDIANLRERVAVLEAGHTEIRAAWIENTRVTNDTKSKLDETDRKVDTLVINTAEVIASAERAKTVKSMVVGLLAWMGALGGVGSALYGILSAYAAWKSLQ